MSVTGDLISNFDDFAFDIDGSGGTIESVLDQRFTENRFRLELGYPLRLGHFGSVIGGSDLENQTFLYENSIKTGCMFARLDHDAVIKNRTPEMIQSDIKQLEEHQKGSAEQQICAEHLLKKLYLFSSENTGNCN